VPFTIAEGRLTFAAASGVTLVFEVQPGPSFDGTWHVASLNNGTQGVVGPRAGTSLTLRFHDGALSGTSGCNTYRSGYVIDEDHISVGVVIVTRKACPAEVMEQERQFLAALGSARRWTIREGRLELRREDGALALAATRAPR
jgi:heat shock protein HslJ